MDWVTISQNAIGFLKKYRYVAIALLLGLLLMLIPEKAPTEESTPQQETSPRQQDLSASLEDILSQIQGAGKVRVLLTCAVGPETVYQVDEELPGAESGGTIRRDTVIVTDSQRGQSGLVRMQIGPEYLGAIVLCQGADSASVRLSIVEAVADATGLPSNCISVLKMK